MVGIGKEEPGLGQTGRDNAWVMDGQTDKTRGRVCVCRIGACHIVALCVLRVMFVLADWMIRRHKTRHTLGYFGEVVLFRSFLLYCTV